VQRAAGTTTPDFIGNEQEAAIAAAERSPRSGQLAISLHHGHALGPLENAFSSRFLHGAPRVASGHGWTRRAGAGLHAAERPSLRHALPGAALLRDLTNIGGLVGAFIRHGGEPGLGFGAPTHGETRTATGLPAIHRQGGREIDLAAPPRHDPLIGPSS
jgi:hypothetical protein